MNLMDAMENSVRDTVVLGTGCAGLTAAIYAARANLKPLVIEGHEPGGQLSMTTLVENFPGFPEGIQGPELIENMRKQAARFGTEYHARAPGNGRSEPSGRSRSNLGGDKTMLTRTLIIASGASARWLGLPNEQALIGHGVSSCATCDGFFFSGKEIAVIGGGDSAMEEALFLTRFATKVTLIHRREQFRASKIMLDRARKHQKIEFLTDTVVEDVLDVEQKEVTGAEAAQREDRQESGTSRPAPCSWASATMPNAKMFDGQLDIDDDGYLKTRDYVFTARPRRLCLRRRAGPPLSAGDHRSRHRLHGGDRGGEVSGRTRTMTIDDLKDDCQ